MCQKVFYAFIQGHQSAPVLHTIHCIHFSLLNTLCPSALQVLLLQGDVHPAAEYVLRWVCAYLIIILKDMCLSFNNLG